MGIRPKPGVRPGPPPAALSGAHSLGRGEEDAASVDVHVVLGMLQS